MPCREWGGDALQNFLSPSVLSVVCYTAVCSVVTQRSSPLGGALRDDTKNGCAADYAQCGFAAKTLPCQRTITPATQAGTVSPQTDSSSLPA